MAHGPKVLQNCTWLHTFNFGDSRQVRTCRTEALFSKLPCLARMSRNVTKADQHGSGSQGPPKLHLAAHFQFWRFATGPDLSNRVLFFKAALPSPNVEKCDQSGSAWLRVPKVPKTALGSTHSILAICDRSGPVELRPFFQSCSAYPQCREM